MQPARIAALLTPFLTPEPGSLTNACHSEPAEAGEEPASLTTVQLHSISTYIDILIRWNASVNLTAVRDPEQIVTRHFGESLFAARHLFPRDAPATDNPFAVADLGSGAGFPGLPIKLWEPHVSLTLIESNHKKVAFLREITRALILTDINILPVRAETLPALAYDVVTLRAVEHFQSILPIAANLLAAAGRLAVLIGDSQVVPAQSSLPHLNWASPIPIPLSRSRVLLVGQREARE